MEEPTEEQLEEWAEHKAERRAKKQNNERQSIAILEDRGIPYRKMPGAAHYRLGDWDFWPTTGKYYNPKTGKKGRGVFELIKVLASEKEETEE